jgi:1-acyl-sn-glycerol-3-phosphate acyltransferase
VRRRRPVYEKGNGWIRLCETIMFPLTHLLGRPRFEGLERLVMPGPVLVVGNHISQLDPLYTAVYLRKSGRIPHIMAKDSLFKIPLLGRVFAGTGMIPVERGGGKGQIGLDAAIAALAAGQMVLIYPDGTVTRDPDQWPMKPRPGVAALALSGDMPVIPVVHWGTQEVVVPYTKKGFHPLPRKDIRVVAGPPIDLSAYRGRPVDSRLVRDVSIVIQTAVRDLLGQVRGETPPVEFYDQKKAERLQARAVADAAGDPGEALPRAGAAGTGTAEPGAGAAHPER